MKRRTGRLFLCGRIAPLLLFAIAAGCREELGPEAIPYTEVQGSVTVSGKPLDRGWVELQPLDATLGVPKSARIQSDGRFHFQAAPIGEVAVRLINVPVDLPGAIWLFRNNSPIRRTTQVAPNPPLSIDVMEEYVRFRTAPESVR